MERAIVGGPEDGQQAVKTKRAEEHGHLDEGQARPRESDGGGEQEKSGRGGAELPQIEAVQAGEAEKQRQNLLGFGALRTDDGHENPQKNDFLQGQGVLSAGGPAC